ncbi:MAG TPA: DnaA regulatory inactivator Hda [Methylococcaceae bacterium]|nr:DnaA regulatory inactivator Hda [Methylococcaceae bacterium]
MSGQIPLELRLDARLDFSGFYPGGNGETVAALMRCAEGGGDAFLFLWGPQGHGKTHLLHAAGGRAGEYGRTAVCLPLGDFARLDPAMLDGIEAYDLVCLDDVDAIAGDVAWEEALLHGFNRLRQMERQLIVASSVSPNQLPIALPDLRSRLAWGMALRLQALDDAGKLAVLTGRARHLGLELPVAVGQYLLARCPRDLPTLWALLDRLDQSSLAARRPLTIPFVKTLLGDKA